MIKSCYHAHLVQQFSSTLYGIPVQDALYATPKKAGVPRALSVDVGDTGSGGGGSGGGSSTPGTGAMGLSLGLAMSSPVPADGGLSRIASTYTAVPALWGRWVFSGGLHETAGPPQGRIPQCAARRYSSEPVRTRLLPALHGDASGVRGAAWLGRDPRLGA